MFLCISHAFDKLWHDGLLFNLRQVLPIKYFIFLKSYLYNRSFFIRQGEELTTLQSINADVPQGSVLGPILYLLYTLDLPIPQIREVTLGTFAVDTVVLSVDKCPMVASKLQTYINCISEWLLNWRIKANEANEVRPGYIHHKTFKLCRTKTE